MSGIARNAINQTRVHNMINLTKPLSQFTISPVHINISNLVGAYFSPDIDIINKDDIAAINVVGRDWYDKIYGNSYNDFTIIFMFKNGMENSFLFGVIEYGYGDYYKQRAKSVLGVLGLANVPTFFNKKDGCKKRDLFTSTNMKNMQCLPLYDTLRLIGHKPSQEI